jgi:hypothetical protein
MKLLKRYWFTFEKLGKPSPLNLGCGVTAYHYDDAINLLGQRVFAGKDLPRIVGYSEDVDLSTLDQKHVLPNIGLATVRGIWFPQGYEEMK